MNRKILLIVIIVGLPLVLGFVADAVQQWHYVFDDAFITYRYAKNLAFGHGITWNPGMPPTEGYTNFLLVVVLAPFIRFDCDPLLITRALSYLSAVAIAVFLFFVARRRHAASVPIAFMIAALVLLTPETSDLCLLGLETIVYSFVLLVVFHFATEFIYSPRTVTSVLLGGLVVLAMLLRPEAALLCVITVVVYVTSALFQRHPHRILHLVPCAFAMLALGGTYLAWRVFHFGQLLPNPFYIKVAGTTLVNQKGVMSVFSFIYNHSVLLAVCCMTVVLWLTQGDDVRRTRTPGTVLGLGCAAAYGAFYARTNTLMDASGRFMFPLVPILIYASLPLLTVVMQEIQDWIQERTVPFSAFVVAFMLAFAPDYFLQAYGNAKRLNPSNRWKTSDSLMQKEYGIAKMLAEFPEIEHVRIAFGDAGVMPYLSGAIWLDVVGLNDSFIARTRDRKALVNYFFNWQPDLVIVGSNKDHSWFRCGHGPLGDYAAWSSDSRWDKFEYVGTCRTAGTIYDLQFLVRKDATNVQLMTDFLRGRVVDGWYSPVPFAIGTMSPTNGIQPTWIPRAEPRD